MRWRSVIGFLAGRSFGSPLASNPSSTCGLARSGSSLPIGSSSESLPCSTSCMPAAAVIALVIEAIQNTLSAVMASSLDEVALAERALIDHLAAGRRHRDHAGNLLGLALLTQNLIDLGFALHGSPPVLFLWSGAIFLPAVRSGKRPRRMSRSRDGQGWAAVRVRRHKTATPRRNRRWMRRYGGDRLNHPRYRDFATIPEADFFSNAF